MDVCLQIPFKDVVNQSVPLKKRLPFEILGNDHNRKMSAAGLSGLGMAGVPRRIVKNFQMLHGQFWGQKLSDLFSREHIEIF